MTYEEAKARCHVRSGIYRIGDPTKVFTMADFAALPRALQRLESNEGRVGTTEPKVYWKNHPTPLDEQVPDEDKLHDDWEEYDPREQPMSSAHDEMPA